MTSEAGQGGSVFGKGAPPSARVYDAPGISASEW